MSQKKRGLSRGLDALLAIKHTANNEINTNNSGNVIGHLTIDQLIPGKFQPRNSITQQELAELVDSIKTQGIIQPLIVRPLSTGNYEIIAGERRWRAATLAELTEVPVIIKDVNDKDALTIALIENIQRENLNPLDEAIALDRLAKEFALTHNEVAVAVGKSRTAITNLLRILQLPTGIKKLLETKQLDLGHAKVLLGAPVHLQLQFANKVVAENLSVRSTEQLVSKYQPDVTANLNNTVNNKSKLQLSCDPDVMKLAQQLSDTLGAKVNIVAKNNSSKGKLIIAYNSLEELQGILEHIKITEDY